MFIPPLFPLCAEGACNFFVSENEDRTTRRHHPPHTHTQTHSVEHFGLLPRLVDLESSGRRYYSDKIQQRENAQENVFVHQTHARILLLPQRLFQLVENTNRLLTSSALNALNLSRCMISGDVKRNSDHSPAFWPIIPSDSSPAMSLTEPRHKNCRSFRSAVSQSLLIAQLS